MGGRTALGHTPGREECGYSRRVRDLEKTVLAGGVLLVCSYGIAQGVQKMVHWHVERAKRVIHAGEVLLVHIYGEVLGARRTVYWEMRRMRKDVWHCNAPWGFQNGKLDEILFQLCIERTDCSRALSLLLLIGCKKKGKRMSLCTGHHRLGSSQVLLFGLSGSGVFF